MKNKSHDMVPEEPDKFYERWEQRQHDDSIEEWKNREQYGILW